MPAKVPNPTMENLTVVVKDQCDIFSEAEGIHTENVRIYESETGWVDLCCND